MFWDLDEGSLRAGGAVGGVGEGPSAVGGDVE